MYANCEGEVCVQHVTVKIRKYVQLRVLELILDYTLVPFLLCSNSHSGSYHCKNRSVGVENYLPQISPGSRSAVFEKTAAKLREMQRSNRSPGLSKTENKENH